MLPNKYIFCIFAMPWFTQAVKVNMQGSLSLGKDIIDSLSHYLRNGFSMNGRRTMPINRDWTSIDMDVNTAGLCKKIEFCKGEQHKFVNSYVTELTQAIEREFSGISKNVTDNKDDSILKKLKGILRAVKNILKKADKRVTSHDEAYTWISVVKQISSLYQVRAITYIVDHLKLDEEEAKKLLIQKIIVTSVAVESKYMKILCKSFNMCLKSFECTRGLVDVLERLGNLSRDNTKEFMKSFSELLLDTTFYSHLNEVTTNEFQVIINDMAFLDTVPTKEVLETVKKTAEARMKAMTSNDEDANSGQDVLLLNAILSDMDHFYSSGKSGPFHGFFVNFVEWALNGGKIKKHMKKVFKNIEDKLTKVSEDLTMKLIYEVRVFLELTVDPDTIPKKNY